MSIQCLAAACRSQDCGREYPLSVENFVPAPHNNQHVLINGEVLEVARRFELRFFVARHPISVAYPRLQSFHVSDVVSFEHVCKMLELGAWNCAVRTVSLKAGVWVGPRCRCDLRLVSGPRMRLPQLPRRVGDNIYLLQIDGHDIHRGVAQLWVYVDESSSPRADTCVFPSFQSSSAPRVHVAPPQGCSRRQWAIRRPWRGTTNSVLHSSRREKPISPHETGLRWSRLPPNALGRRQRQLVLFPSMVVVQ